MQIELKYRPSYSLGIVHLDPNETLQVEGGSMVSMSSDIAIKTQARGRIAQIPWAGIAGRRKLFPEHLPSRS